MTTKMEDNTELVSCGFGKWSIGFDKNDYSVVVKYNHYPNVGEIRLYDVSEKELVELGKLFLKASEK